jgi:glycosyltransferase involved in cell wall biosynthesis
MNILYICNEYPPSPHGGIGVMVKGLANYFSKNGHNVFILGQYDIDEDLIEFDNSVKVYRYKNRRYFPSGLSFFNVCQSWLERKRVHKLINRVINLDQIDIVESFDWSGPIINEINIPLVVRLHGSHTANGMYLNNKTSILLRYFESRTLNLADHIISISEHTLRITNAVFSLKREISIINNFVDLDLFFRDKSIMPNKEILYVGKYHPNKGMAELFYQIHRILESFEDYSFRFIGNISLTQQKTVLAPMKSNITDRIFFEGVVEHSKLPFYYNQAKVFIMPSKAEAFGLTTVEAMACGCPIAMNNTASGPELIRDGKTGMLIDFNDPKKATVQLLNFIGDEFKLNSMRMNCVNEAYNRFSLAQCGMKTLSVYNILLNNQSN